MRKRVLTDRLILLGTVSQCRARNHDVVVHIMEVKCVNVRGLVLVLGGHHIRTSPRIEDDTTNLVPMRSRVPGIKEHLHVTSIALNDCCLVGESLTLLLSVKVNMLDSVVVLVRTDRRDRVGGGFLLRHSYLLYYDILTNPIKFQL